MKKAIFLSHLREAAIQRGVVLEQVLCEARALGFEGVECDYHDVAPDVPGFVQMLTRAELTVSGVFNFFNFPQGINQEEIEAVVRAAFQVGSKKLLAIPGEWDGKNAAAMDRMVEGLTILCRVAEPYGITVTLEDFGNVASPCSTAEGLQFFFDQVPGLKFTLDTGNFLYMDQDVVKCGQQLLPLLAHIHLKDCNLVPLYPQEQPIMSVGGVPLYPAPVGQGVIPMKSVIQLAKQVGYDGFCTVEYFGAIQPWEYIQQSAHWLRRNL